MPPQQKKVNQRRELLIFNVGIILLSTSGVLGRAILTNSFIAIFYRAFFAAVIMLFISKLVRGMSLRIHAGDHKDVWIVSIFLAGHWLTYFFALDYSNVAIALISLYTFPMMTTFLEPMILKTRLYSQDVLLGFLVIVGVVIMMPEFDISHEYTWAIVLGLISALFYSLRNIYVCKLSARYDDFAFMTLQMSIISMLLLPTIFVLGVGDIDIDWWKLLLLSVVTTVCGHTLYVRGLRHFTANTAGLMAGVVPLYGIFWAYFFLDESPDVQTLIGGGIVLLVAFYKGLQPRKS